MNLALAGGIRLWDVWRTGGEELVLKVNARDFRRLRPVARAAQAKVRITRKVGLPFQKRAWRGRPGFVAGSLLFLIIIYLFFSFIWSVTVRSSEELRYLSPAQITSWAAGHGLHPGAWRPSLDANRLAEEMVSDFQELAWAGIYFEGTRAVIEVAERRFPEASTYNGPAHLVAARDALIREVVVVDGQARVTPGDTVRQGEVLISGLVLPLEPGLPRLVRARGQVKGTVWYEAVGEAFLVEEKEIPTGRTARNWELQLGEWVIRLPGRRPDFASFISERQEIGWGPVTLVQQEVRETRKEVTRRDRDTALQMAYSQAVADLTLRLPPGAQLEGDYQMQVLASDARRVRVKVTVQTSEDITLLYPL